MTRWRVETKRGQVTKVHLALVQPRLWDSWPEFNDRRYTTDRCIFVTAVDELDAFRKVEKWLAT